MVTDMLNNFSSFEEFFQDSKPTAIIIFNSSMLFLGIDQSLVNSGVCLFDSDGSVELYSIKPGNLKGSERLDFIANKIQEYLDMKPAMVCMEGYSYGSYGRTFELGELGGILKLLFFRSDIPVTIVPPKALKKFLTGNGNADKMQILKQVSTKYKISPKDDNQADAFGLAKIAQMLYTDTTPLIEYEREVVYSLQNPKKKIRKKTKKLVKVSI